MLGSVRADEAADFAELLVLSSIITDEQSLLGT
jgi:hypothetical protein